MFFGAAALRLREADFEPAHALPGTGGRRWPYSYGDLEEYYGMAERILGVAGEGEGEGDPTEPPHSAPYPQGSLPELCQTSQRIWDASLRLGLTPFRLPLAVNFSGKAGRTACIQCATCDGFACAIDAKNDPAGSVIPPLLRKGMELKAGVVAVRLVRRGRRVKGVQCVEVESGRRVEFRASNIVLSAGALGSPHLILASGLRDLNPAPDAVGRYLMRHCNAMVFGLFRDPLGNGAEFRKQIGIHDFYFGDPDRDMPHRKLGGIQQVQGVPEGLLAHRLPAFLKWVAPRLSHRITGLLAIAEDEPRIQNGVNLHPRRFDRYGLPQLVINHRYTRGDLAARRALVLRAREILREAGAKATVVYPITTFSHAVGTLRMGEDPWESPLDPTCRFRGTENLFVVDGSFMPSSGGVNPSLTIGANALRAAEKMAEASRVTAAVLDLEPFESDRVFPVRSSIASSE